MNQITDLPINIMTSCDDKLAVKICITLQSIADHLSHKKIDFFLLHSRVSKENIDLLAKQCLAYGHIRFHEVRVDSDSEAFKEMAEYGGGWCEEAYYSLCAHELLPENIDRALYLDAGDTLVLGDIDEYYFEDFEGKSLIVTGSSFKMSEGKKVLFESDDLADRALLAGIVRGIFNSGSYVMNLDKIHKSGNQISDYLELARTLKTIAGDSPKAYWGDQGLLSAAFVGDIKCFEYPRKADPWYMPYNFCVWFFDQMKEQPQYAPGILHFAGGIFKPWQGNYPIFLERFQNKKDMGQLRNLKLGQAEYYYLWHETAIRTEETLRKLGM